MIVSHRHRLIFLKTLKTAGTSVEIALSTLCGPDDTITPVSPRDERLRAEVGGLGPQHYEAPPLSEPAFNHIRAAAIQRIFGDDVWHSYTKVAIERNPWDTVVSLYYWSHRDRELPPFDAWVQEPFIENLARRNASIYRIKGQIVVDHVCRYENLVDDLAEVADKIGMPRLPGLPRAKGGSRPRTEDRPATYRDLYTPASEQRVREVFAKSVRDFGYEF